MKFTLAVAEDTQGGRNQCALGTKIMHRMPPPVGVGCRQHSFEETPPDNSNIAGQ